MDINCYLVILLTNEIEHVDDKGWQKSKVI